MNAIPSNPGARAKPRQKRALGVPLVISEHGLDARYARGEVSVNNRAPDDGEGGNPNRSISRARVVWAYDRLHSRDAIDDDMREACDKYAMLAEMESGAAWQNGEVVGGRRPAWQKGHPIHTAIQATAALRSVHKALGPRARGIVRLLVVDNLTVKQIAARVGWFERNDAGELVRRTADEKQVMGLVHAALTRMVEHWEIGEDQGRSLVDRDL